MKRRIAVLVSAALAVASLSPLVSSAGAKPKPPKPSADRVIMFASDGMRQDLMQDFASEDAMPTFSSLMDAGVEGANGLSQAFPGNTGVGWATLATGTYPSDHGSTNNTFHRTGADFTGTTSAFATGILQSDTIMQAAERAGKTVVSMEWVAGRALTPALQGPTVDFRTFFSNRGVLVNFDLPGQPAGANEFGVSYQRVDLDDAAGWTNVPESFSPAKQESLLLTNTAFPASVNHDRRYDLYVYDSTDDATENYDSVLAVPQEAAKDGAEAVADLGQGEWADVKVTLDDTRAGQTAGFYLKAIDIAPDLSEFRIYFTSIARSNATYNGCTYAPGCSGPLGFEETLNAEFPSPTAGDFAPLEGGIVDEDTYAEQGLMWKDAHWAYLTYIVDELGVDPDLLMLGTPTTDEFQHQFLALVTPEDIDGDPNPFFDDVENDDVADGRVDARTGYLRSAYAEADGTLGLARDLLGDAAVFASSDHGFAPQWLAINARKVLAGAMVTSDAGPVSVHPSGGTGTANCRADAAELAKACWAGGTAQIYVNPTLPNGVTYEEVRSAVIDAFEGVGDPGAQGAQVIETVLRKEDLRDVQGSDSLHPNRSGDVVVVARPPYQFDAATSGVAIAPSKFFGQHGYLPELVDLEHNVNMHGMFVAAGPGIRALDTPVEGVRAIDVAPTASFLLGIPGPQSARGKILTQLFTTPGRWKQVAILDISDYHGQLIPLAERSDTVGPTFPIGGAAFLKPWFDAYRAELPAGQTLTVTAGDAVGATPPISAAFGDVPTIELMNLMGFSLDGLGNHNFDQGQTYLREELIPLADFPYVSANIVDPATGDPPAEWSRSHVFDLDGFKLRVVGFSNDDLEELIFPGNLDPFVVEDALAAVNAEASRLRASGAGPVVAIGHMGATGGTFNAPTGPGIALADGIASVGGTPLVDAVIGDHTSFQTITTRQNGVLFVENLSKGVRFTRVRLVVDASTKQVVYKTADWHRPFAIGVTPDPAIQAEIDALNEELGPILGTHVADSTVGIPRADLCGHPEGRTCESLVGDVVTDAMRTTYGVDFAITNSGGLRADLTCPTTDSPDDFCPAFVPPPFPITRGQVLGVLPFGNVVSTVEVSGVELRAFLENGVSQMPAVAGRFPQVSGLCFEYDVSQPAGSRVVGSSVVRQAADGSCTGDPVDLTAASTYSLAINDFMASGGDGYPNVFAKATTRDVMDEVVAHHLEHEGTVSPEREDRVLCITTGPTVCPTFAP